jgi:hypothetical protein
MQHRLALFRVQAVEELIGVGDLPGISHVLHTQSAPLLLIASPCIVVGGIFRLTYRRSATPLRLHAFKWHTQFVLNMQRRFFYGYRPAVPVA